MLNSLQVTNFRPFRNLSIHRIGKVNLIVGRNNVGKTSLLEAVHLYSSDDVIGAVVRLLERREEYTVENNNTNLLFNSLFYHAETTVPIAIGEISGDNQVVIRPMWRWIEEIEEKDGVRTQSQFSPHLPEDIELEERKIAEFLTVKRQKENLQYISIESPDRPYSSRLRVKYENRKNSLLLPSSGFQDDSIDIAMLWDRVVLTDKEDTVLEALKVIEPDLERIVMVQGKRSQRLAMTKLLKQRNMPLRSLGDGMNKLFELALGLVNVGEDRVFLVDEIDSGLHFTTLVDVWQIVFQTAAKLNIQVFATTHSWNCIEAFQQVATEHPADGLLIRLERNESDIRAEVFSEEELTIITRESIEVR